MSTEFLDTPPVINKQPERPKDTVCPKCSSEKVGIFPNCIYTYGCTDCGNAFIRKPKKERSKWSRK